MLKVRPHTKSGGGGGGGGGQFASGPIRKGGGGGASGPIYEMWGGGGGQFASGPIPLGTQKISTCTVPTYVLPRYTSHARANERKIHAGNYYNFFVIHMLGGACALHAPPNCKYIIVT